jgi:HlyD family secretion protein
VLEQDAAAVSVGQRAQVWIDGSGERWAGRVTHVSGLMGRRSARSLDPTDRFDRDVREVFVTLDDGSAPPLVGLRVTVGLQ